MKTENPSCTCDAIGEGPCPAHGFTLEEIERTIKYMKSRLHSGQGGLDSPMCRLSMPMSEWLLKEIKYAATRERTRCLRIALKYTHGKSYSDTARAGAGTAEAIAEEIQNGPFVNHNDES